MENKDAKLIRKYLNLVESFDNKKTLVETDDVSEKVSEEPLDEQVKMFQDALKTLARTAEIEKGLWSTIKSEIPQIGNTYKSAAEFKAAVEAGKVGAAESASLVKFAIKNSPELAMKIKGLLKTQPEFAEMAKLIFPKGTQMPADAAKMAIAQKTLSQMGIDAKAAETMLRDAAQGAAGTAQVTTKAVDKAIARRAAQMKGGEAEVKALVKDVNTAQDAANGIKQEITKVKEPGIRAAWQKSSERIGKYAGEKWAKLKELKGKMNWKKLVLYGLAGYGAIEVLKSLFGDGKNEVLQPCVVNLPDSELSTTSGGDPVVMYRKDDLDPSSAGHGGLKFYETGRVWTVDNAMSGNYSCTPSGQVTATVSENLLNEAAPTIKITWDTKKDDGTVPPKPQESKWKKCDSFPMNIYCISDKIKEVQDCLCIKADGKFGNVTAEKMGAKTLTQDLYDKIKANCKPCKGTGDEPVTEPDRDLKPVGPVKIGDRPVKDITAPNKINPNVKIPNLSGISDEAFYNQMKEGGYLKGDTSETTLDDGTTLPPSRRIKFKGPDLSAEQVGKLDNVLSGLGYERIKQKIDKSYGDKYVWLKK